MALQSNEPIGTTARLGVLRLGAGRLGAVPLANQLTPGTGLYAWGAGDAHPPPGSVSGGGTVVQS